MLPVVIFVGQLYLRNFVHHSLLPLRKCNSLRDCGHINELSYLWPPNSPNLDAVDYKIWDIIQQQLYQTQVQDVNDLKQRLIDV